MMKILLTFVAPILLGLHLSDAVPAMNGAPLMSELGVTREDMMRYSRRMELFQVRARHEVLSFNQKANIISKNIATGLHQLENFSLDGTVGQHFDVATNQLRDNQQL